MEGRQAARVRSLQWCPVQQPGESLGLHFPISTWGLQMCFCCGQKHPALPEVNSKADGLGLMNGKAYMYSFEKLGLTIIMASRMQERARSAIARVWGRTTVSLCSQDFKLWSFSFIPVLVLVMAAVEREAFFFLPSFIFPQEIFDCFQKGADFQLFPSSSQSD